eukprot:9399728-Pyramimonas_sp.AAC.1
MIRDDIMMWAFSFGNYREWFRQNDTPIGQDCVRLPEADGDTRYGMEELRNQRFETQETRTTAILNN